MIEQTTTSDGITTTRIVIGVRQATETTATRAGDADVNVIVTYGADGIPLIIIDCEEHAHARIMVNEGALADIRDGGERIILPVHADGFERDMTEPDDATDMVTVDQNACDRCGADVEAFSDAPTVWTDRGGNRHCSDATHDGMPHASRFRH